MPEKAAGNVTKLRSIHDVRNAAGLIKNVSSLKSCSGTDHSVSENNFFPFGCNRLEQASACHECRSPEYTRFLLPIDGCTS